MKKILYSLLALVSLLATSCSNDDIEITTYAPKNEVRVNVSTTSAYESFGISYYTNFLAENENAYVGITSLLYDKDGKFVAEENSYSRTIQQVQQKLAIPDGTYTLITLVTLVEKDGEEYKSPFWQLAEKNDISTVRVDKKYYNVYWCYSLAVAAKTIKVNGDNITENISPVPAGSLLSIGYENFDKSSYVWFGYELKQSPDGLNLDPSLSGVNKYYYADGYNQSNVWTGQWTTYEESGLTEDNADMFILNEGRLNYCFGLTDDYSGSGNVSFTAYPTRDEYYTFRNGDMNKAYCYYVGGDKVCETYMGDGSDFNEWYDNVTKGNNNGGNNGGDEKFKFVEPVIDWGASVRNVQSYMSSYDMFLGSDGTAEYFYEGTYAIAYNGNYSEDMIAYYFSSATTGLKESTLYYDATKVTESQLSDVLNEKYEYAGYESDMHLFFTSDFATGIALYQSDDKATWYVDYMSLEDYSGDVKAAKRALSEKRNVKMPAKRTSKKYMNSSLRLRK